MPNLPKMPRYVFTEEVSAVRIGDPVTVMESGNLMLPVVEDGFAPIEVEAAQAVGRFPQPGDFLVVYGDGHRLILPPEEFAGRYKVIQQDGPPQDVNLQAWPANNAPIQNQTSPTDDRDAQLPGRAEDGGADGEDVGEDSGSSKKEGLVQRAEDDWRKVEKKFGFRKDEDKDHRSAAAKPHAYDKDKDAKKK